MKNILYTFRDHLKEQLKDKKFKRIWKKSEVDYLLAKQLIEKRIKQKLSQRTLAKKIKTSQVVISRLETMKANPSLSLLKRLAEALNTKLILKFE